MRQGNWMIMASGGKFYPSDPRPEDVKIEDIAHALSLLCRWGGHCPEFYSVAQHSVLVSRQVPEQHALTALLHDATEAYLGDVPRPIKVCLPEYKSMEQRVWLSIAKRFGLPDDLPQCVHDADNAVLLTEAIAFFGAEFRSMCTIGVPDHIAPAGLPSAIRCWDPTTSAIKFTQRFLDLTTKEITS